MRLHVCSHASTAKLLPVPDCDHFSFPAKLEGKSIIIIRKGEIVYTADLLKQINPSYKNSFSFTFFVNQTYFIFVLYVFKTIYSCFVLKFRKSLFLIFLVTFNNISEAFSLLLVILE